MITLKRAQIGRGAGLDITVKSSQAEARLMAPTWDMVMGHKNGRLTDGQYTERYNAILVRNEVAIVEYLQTQEQWVFLCYCRDGQFCHTYLLMDWLVAKYPNIFQKGE